MELGFVKMGKVYSYMRFSDAKQSDGNSIERQKNYAERWAKDHGMTLDTSLTMKDEGLSAYHQKHVKSGALGIFLKSIEDGRIDPGSVLIVEGLDRLSRAEPIVAQGQLALIVNAGIAVVTAADDKIYSREAMKSNSMDLIYSLLVMIRAHEESETKSKRVRGAIASLCERWQNGSYRGIIRQGRDPGWVKWNGTRFELIPDEAIRMRRMAELYMMGYGGKRINDALASEGLRPEPTYTNTYRFFTRMQHLLAGTKIVTVDHPDPKKGSGEYRLEGYYPPLLSAETFAQLVTQIRSFSKGPATVPGILSGNAILRCGYCGAAMSMHVHTYRRRADGVLTDGFRRMRCHSEGCPSASFGSVPYERALVSWCSDQMNLNSLIRKDDSTDIRVRIAKGRQGLAELDKQLENLTDALVKAESAAPAIVIKRMNEIELLKTDLQVQIRSLESQLLKNRGEPLQEASVAWASLHKAAIDDMDFEARMQLRQMVVETFTSIVVYRYGMSATPIRSAFYEMLVISKSGVKRQLRINKHGEVVACRDVAEPPSPSPVNQLF